MIHTNDYTGKKWVTLVKLVHTWKNGSHLKSGSHVVKRVKPGVLVTLGKVGYT